MEELISILKIVAGIITTIAGTVGTIYLNGKRKSKKTKHEDVDNTIKLTDAMSSVVDLLEKEIDLLSQRMKTASRSIKERDASILRLRKERNECRAEMHRLKLKYEGDSNA